MDNKPTNEAEYKEAIENSQRMIEHSKDLVSRLKKDIEHQEKLLAKQRENLNRMLDDLGIEHE